MNTEPVSTDTPAHIYCLLGDTKNVILTADGDIVPNILTADQAWDWLKENGHGEVCTVHVVPPRYFVTSYVTNKGILCMGCPHVNPAAAPGTVAECGLLSRWSTSPITDCPALPRNHHPLHRPTV